MLTIFFHSVKANYRAAPFVGIGLALMAQLFAGLYKDMIGQVSDFASMVPSGMSAVIGDISNVQTPEGWLGIELFALFFPVSLAILGVVYGARLIGREEDTGTLEIILAGPVSRLKLVVQKLFALIKLLAVPAVILWVSVALGSIWFDFSPNLWHVAQAVIAGWLLGLVYGTVAFMTQAISGKSGLATGVGIGVFFVTYMITIVSQLVDSWKDTQWLSPFRYYDASNVLSHGFDAENVITLITLGALFSLIALLAFPRRDIRS